MKTKEELNANREARIAELNRKTVVVADKTAMVTKILLDLEAGPKRVALEAKLKKLEGKAKNIAELLAQIAAAKAAEAK